MDMAYKIGTFLCPEFRQLSMLSVEDKLSVHNYIHGIFSDAIVKPTSAETTVKEPASKKTKMDFSEWTDLTEKYDIDNEIQRYIHRPLAADENLDAKEFPLLGSLAKQTFAIPASSASSERNFRAAGQVLSERRTSLLPENVDSILFLHDSLYKEDVK